MLFDRDSRPYFGDLAELADRGEEVPVLGPPDNRGLLHQLFVVGTFAVGPNVLNDGAVMMSESDHGRGVRLMVVGSPGLHLASSSRRAPMPSPCASSSTSRWSAAAR